MTAAIRIEGLVKSFTLHNQGGVRLSVLAGFGLAVEPGECVALHGPSGIGKSTVLRCIYANYRADRGASSSGTGAGPWTWRRRIRGKSSMYGAAPSAM